MNFINKRSSPCEINEMQHFLRETSTHFFFSFRAKKIEVLRAVLPAMKKKKNLNNRRENVRKIFS